jgi:hypothetical protein
MARLGLRDVPSVVKACVIEASVVVKAPVACRLTALALVQEAAVVQQLMGVEMFKRLGSARSGVPGAPLADVNGAPLGGQQSPRLEMRHTHVSPSSPYPTVHILPSPSLLRSCCFLSFSFQLAPSSCLSSTKLAAGALVRTSGGRSSCDTCRAPAGVWLQRPLGAQIPTARQRHVKKRWHHNTRDVR